MSCLWISLLCAALFLQGSASSKTRATNQGVSLNCTVSYAANVTVDCTINTLEKNCHCKEYIWETSGNVTLHRKCESDNLTYVSLTIPSNPFKEEIYTVEIETSCGMAKESVTVEAFRSPPPESTPPEYKPRYTVTIILLSIFAILVVLGILYFLFRTDRGFNQYAKGLHTKEDALTNSEICALYV